MRAEDVDVRGPRAWALWTLCLLAACGGPVEAPRSALVITLDTTRADALGCYGGARELTPHLDRIAAEGVRHDAAYATVPLTLPSHASMWTGLYPLRHSVRDNGLWPLPAGARTAAELAAAAGAQTAAFVASIVLDASFGLDQGFGVYRQPARELIKGSNSIEELSATEIVDRALAWFGDRDRSRPFLAWVHFYDPHGPAEVPDLTHVPEHVTGEPGRGLWAGYLPRIAFMDREIGRLLARLEADGSLDNALLLVVGDHGEALGEHGEASHGSQCYDAVMRVPLLLRTPDRRRAGEVSDSLASVVDVLPTVLEFMGLEAPTGLDGLSLLRVPAPEDRGVYFESYHGYLSYEWSPLAAWQDRAGKYLHSSRPRFFEPRVDAREEQDLLAERAPRVEAALANLRRLESLPRLEPELGHAADGVLLDQLQSLGYAAVPGRRDELPEPSATSTRLAPEEGIAIERRVARAMRLNDQGDSVAAQQLIQRILLENPGNHVAQDQLAISLLRQSRHAEAAEVLERLLANGPRWAHSSFNLGVCRAELGQESSAIEAFVAAIEVDSAQAADVWALVSHYRRSGRRDLAGRLEAGLNAAGVVE